MAHVIERHETQIEHHHTIIQAEVIAPARWNALNETHHVIREIANRTRDERRQSRHADRAVARGEPSKLLDRILVKLNALPGGLQCAHVSTRAEYLFRIGTGKRVTSDRLAAFDAFEQERVFRVARDA